MPPTVKLMNGKNRKGGVVMTAGPAEACLARAYPGRGVSRVGSTRTTTALRTSRTARRTRSRLHSGRQQATSPLRGG